MASRRMQGAPCVLLVILPYLYRFCFNRMLTSLWNVCDLITYVDAFPYKMEVRVMACWSVRMIHTKNGKQHLRYAKPLRSVAKYREWPSWLHPHFNQDGILDDKLPCAFIIIVIFEMRSSVSIVNGKREPQDRHRETIAKRFSISLM